MLFCSQRVTTYYIQLLGFSLKWLKGFKGSFKKPSFYSSKQLIKIFSVVLLLVNVPISAYFCLVHQRGGYAVMDLLRREHVYNFTLFCCHIFYPFIF